MIAELHPTLCPLTLVHYAAGPSTRVELARYHNRVLHFCGWQGTQGVEGTVMRHVWEFLSSDAKQVAIAVVAAIVGAVVKWLLDRGLINSLKADLDFARRDRERAAADRQAALQSRQDALGQREVAILELFEREAELKSKRDRVEELEREIQGREIDVTAQRSALDRLITSLRGSETGIWLTHGRHVPANYDERVAQRRPLTIVIANNKGGVGKTTLAGNLIAYFDRELRKRVLALDLDYQGSLSTMLRSEQTSGLRRRASEVNALLEPGATVSTLWMSQRPLGERLLRSALVPAFYELAKLEDQLLVEWLLQEGDDDVRYRLAKVLLQDEVAEKFDVVLMDVPPRLTTGTINALCASNYVLVPATFNPLAAEPVANFIRTAKGLMDTLNPKLQFVGVVETMSPPPNQAHDVRAEGRRVISEAVADFNPPIQILDAHVPRRTFFTDGVAYLASGPDGRQARQIFNALGDELKRRTGL